MGNHLFIVILRYLVSLDGVLSHREAHLTFLEQYYQQGIFLASGPQAPRYGGVILAKSENRETLMTILEQDPFYRHQCAEYQVFEFIPTKYSEAFIGFLEAEKIAIEKGSK